MLVVGDSMFFDASKTLPELSICLLFSKNKIERMGLRMLAAKSKHKLSNCSPFIQLFNVLKYLQTL